MRQWFVKVLFSTGASSLLSVGSSVWAGRAGTNSANHITARTVLVARNRKFSCFDAVIYMAIIILGCREFQERKYWGCLWNNAKIWRNTNVKLREGTHYCLSLRDLTLIQLSLFQNWETNDLEGTLKDCMTQKDLNSHMMHFLKNWWKEGFPFNHESPLEWSEHDRTGEDNTRTEALTERDDQLAQRDENLTPPLCRRGGWAKGVIWKQEGGGHESGRCQ